MLELLTDECSTLALTDELLTIGLVITLFDEALTCSCLPEELVLTLLPVSTIPFGSLDGLTLAIVAVVPPLFVGLLANGLSGIVFPSVTEEPLSAVLLLLSVVVGVSSFGCPTGVSDGVT